MSTMEGCSLLKEVQIGAKHYSIVECDSDHFELLLEELGANNHEARSFIAYDQQLIVVRSELHQDTKKEYIIHELLHAMLDDAGLSEDVEVEHFVKALAPRLTIFLTTQSFI